MPSPAFVQREEPMTSLPPSAAKVTQELPLISPELSEALLVERGNLRCDVLLWQRWVRYLALGAMVLLTLLFSFTVQNAFWPLVAISAGYIGVVMSTAWILQHNRSPAAQTWFPSLLLTADIAALAGFCYLTSAPQQLHRILLLGFLSMQL
ncbi:MAG: hypothetical protein ABI205_03590, partial [Gemmatimonadaceae bacterium]